jgi:undecaprenyl-diphosphatase
MSTLTTLNTNTFFTINSWAGKSPILDTLIVFSARYAIYFLFLVAALCVAYLFYRKQWRPIVFFSISLATSFIILFIASKLFASDRPFVNHHITQLIPHAANQSFPSDHSTASMALALALLAFTRFKKTAWLLVIAAILIGFSRIVAGVHYPLDVVGGFITAILGTVLAYLVYRLQPVKQTVRFNSDSTDTAE